MSRTKAALDLFKSGDSFNWSDRAGGLETQHTMTAWK